MPAAAVIPAPIAYIKIVAVKKLVVGFLVRYTWPASVYGVVCRCVPSILREIGFALHWVEIATPIIYFEKIRVFKAGLRYEYISME